MKTIDMNKFEGAIVENKPHEINPEDSFVLYLQNPVTLIEEAGINKREHQVVACLLNKNESATREINSFDKDAPPVINVNAYLLDKGGNNLGVLNFRIQKKKKDDEKNMDYLITYLPALGPTQPIEGIWSMTYGQGDKITNCSVSKVNGDAVNQVIRALTDCREEKVVAMHREYVEDWKKNNPDKLDNRDSALSLLTPQASSVKGSNSVQMTDEEKELDKALEESTIS